MTSRALWFPLVVGVKLTRITHPASTSTTVPAQALTSEKALASTPAIARRAIGRGVGPRLVRLTVWRALVMFMSWWPNSTSCGVSKRPDRGATLDVTGDDALATRGLGNRRSLGGRVVSCTSCPGAAVCPVSGMAGAGVGPSVEGRRGGG